MLVFNRRVFNLKTGFVWTSKEVKYFRIEKSFRHINNYSGRLIYPIGQAEIIEYVLINILRENKIDRLKLKWELC